MQIVQHRAVLGSAGNGRVSAATRADYAAAAVAVPSASGQEKKVYELSGDQSFTLIDLAAEKSFIVICPSRSSLRC